MPPENMPSPGLSGAPLSSIRPPDFLLPKTEQTPGRRQGQPDIYVSWDDQIFGPAAVDDVINGVRTGYFEDDALFWFEGREEWRPIAELPGLFDSPAVTIPPPNPPRMPPAEGIRPKWPGSSSRSSSSTSSSRGERRRRRSNKGRSGKSSLHALGGRLIVIGAVLLAVLITAGLLLLISLV